MNRGFISVFTSQFSSDSLTTFKSIYNTHVDAFHNGDFTMTLP